MDLERTIHGYLNWYEDGSKGGDRDLEWIRWKIRLLIPTELQRESRDLLTCPHLCIHTQS